MSAVARLVYHVPVIGWALREAVEGSETAKVLFVVNCLLIWILAIVWFGFPAIIIPALAGVAIMFVLLIMITWDDFGARR